MDKMIVGTINKILKRNSFCEEIFPYHKLQEDLGLESLDLVELVVELEECFNIEFDESDLGPSQFQTVDQVYSLVEKYVGMKNAL